MKPPKPIRGRDRALKQLTKKMDADFYCYSGPIDLGAVSHCMEIMESSMSHKNVGLVLTTPGGDPDAAYRLVRFTKRLYTKFTLFVFGFCKSAGTLAALGADEIIMSSWGELGPLDIQLMKPDEITELSSGLDISMAIEDLGQKAFGILETQFLELKFRSGGAITTKTAAEIAQAVSIGLLAPVTAQIDPLRLGATCRAMRIAMEYGKRLNVSQAVLDRLASQYPCHSFAIDCQEAADIFANVSSPTRLVTEFEYDLKQFFLQQFGRDILRIPPADGSVFVGKIEPDKTNKRKIEEVKNDDNLQNEAAIAKNKKSGNGSPVRRPIGDRKQLPAVQG